jgi:hypothetical protein
MSENIIQKMKIGNRNFVIIIVIIRKYLIKEENNVKITYLTMLMLGLELYWVAVKFR